MVNARRLFPIAFGILLAATAFANTPLVPGKTDPDGLTLEKLEQQLPEYFSKPTIPGASVEALPDVFGPGSVTTVGNIFMKVTNWGHVGNLFPQLSSDPMGQWPGASGIEYLSSIRLLVCGVNPLTGDVTAKRRVSYLLEWRPETLDPVDKIYRAYDGIVNGTRFVNDDADNYIDPNDQLTHANIDEDFLDGHDNDGDTRVDEDYGALGQQMYSFVMWDNTIQAINSTFNEKHVPLGLECRQRVWAYSIRGFQDFNVMEYEIFNRSGHDLDSVSVGFLVDMDAGPYEQASYFQDDLDLPHFPSGEFPVTVGGTLPDPQLKQLHPDPLIPDAPDSVGINGLCGRYKIRINGFSIADDNGDENKTYGIPSFLLVDHSVDPLGRNGPKKVGFRAFRSFTGGTPFAQGGNPTIDQQRFEFMTGTDNIDMETGFVKPDFIGGDSKGDYIQLVAVGSPVGVQAPGESHGLWHLANGQSIKVTVAFAVKDGRYNIATSYVPDYARYQLGTMSGVDLLNKYPVLANAFALQIAFEGIHVLRQEGFVLNDYHGRETKVRRPLGSPDSVYTENCPTRETRFVTVNSRDWSWFDFDCDYCTGPWNYEAGRSNPSDGGLFHKTWNAEAPPPNPNLNVAINYNYSDNPNRKFIPAGDREVVLAWDNLSEVTPDPKSECFDFRGYRVWKVSDWTRPVGAAGPGESDWRLIADYRLFDYEILGVPVLRNYTIDPVTGEKRCPMVYVPNYAWYDSLEHVAKLGKMIPMCLEKGDLWDKQSGEILKADTTVQCIPDSHQPSGCDQALGGIVHRTNCKDIANKIVKYHYPIGRYRYVDHEVKNGFTYFYSVTAVDSAYENSITTELEGRRSSVEAEGVTPQAPTSTGHNVWVVPNPYRGYAHPSDRPSAWDLTPNAADPTGTHIDFFGLPRGTWAIKIFTVSGDLVAELNSSDPVNESNRSPQTSGGQTLPGYNRQQDNPNDGQARWNLISRNGQDIVSGIYLFTVDSNEGTQRGKFIVIR